MKMQTWHITTPIAMLLLLINEIFASNIAARSNRNDGEASTSHPNTSSKGRSANYQGKGAKPNLNDQLIERMMEKSVRNRDERLAEMSRDLAEIENDNQYGKSYEKFVKLREIICSFYGSVDEGDKYIREFCDEFKRNFQQGETKKP